ncbi:DNA ligase/mRNA capping enzyme, partial [Dendrothele bispora CBS 962.96]
LEVFRNWKEALYAKFSPLPPGTTRIIFRLLFPEADTRRRYHMQETGLSLEIMKCFGVNDARLTNWSKDGHSGCLGQEVKNVLEDTLSDSDGWVCNLSLQDVDELLDELASLSPWSHSSLDTRHSHQRKRRSRQEILKSLYRPLAPLDAAVVTQIILKDLDGLLYPIDSEQSTTEALKSYNSLSLYKLNKEDAMKVWDPENRMLKTYSVRNSLDDASTAFESGTWLHTPKVGSFLGMPKSCKARSPSNALKILGSSDLVYAETKYDGERAQIHVELVDGTDPRLTIFSKSQRDSTLDRIALHPIIIRCLGLNSSKTKFKKNIILDAEMVAFDGLHIDEYWRIHGLIQATASGIRRKHEQKSSCYNLRVNSAERYRNSSNTKHLGLVFFDVMYMDGSSLLSVPYWKRRILLEDLITPDPGTVLLSARWALNLDEYMTQTSESQKRYIKDPVLTSLCNVFVERTILHFEEGLILKAACSSYNDPRSPWVKLKRDYIPGFGDTIDLVLLGVGWDKERGEKLGGTVESFVFLLKLSHEKSGAFLPHFHIYCTSTYVDTNGDARESLETLNFTLKSDGLIPFEPANMKLPYTFSICHTLPLPTALLAEPLVIEVLGDRFTKTSEHEPYQPRHPRILKWFRPSDRSWRESVKREDLDDLVANVLGLDYINDDNEDEWANRLWGKPGSS